MPYVSTEAIVLRRSPYSETSLIVSVFTRDYGKQRLIAKGARRQRKAGYGGIEPLTHLNIVFLHKETGGLQTLSEWHVREGFGALREELDRLYAAIYAVELVEVLTEEGDANEAVFLLLLRTLVRLSEGEEIARTIVGFELRLLRFAGLFPLVRQCTGCGEPVEKLGTICFSSRRGGCVCERCLTEGDGAIRVTKRAMNLIELLSSDFARAERVKLDKGALAELRGVIENYLRYILGRKPRMWRFLRARQAI